MARGRGERQVYPGTRWPMHPEIHRLRCLGLPRDADVYNRLKPPPGCVRRGGGERGGRLTRLNQTVLGYRRAIVIGRSTGDGVLSVLRANALIS